MIISGSPVISQFDFKSRVSFICVPGVVKLRNGDYTSLGDHVDLSETLAMRASIIQHTAEAFSPDAFIVDKEPLGLRGEVEPTLKILKSKGVKNILGLRDVMDDAAVLNDEWRRKKVVPAIENLYDEIWIYGTKHIGNPIKGIQLTPQAVNKMVYLGYLRRQIPCASLITSTTQRSPYLLITPGGGGDGEDLVDWVIRAYEAEQKMALPTKATEKKAPEKKDLMKPKRLPKLLHGVIVLGPFMSMELRNAFTHRVKNIANLELRVFDNQIENLMSNASGVVAMGGYNTFCEILSFDKPAIIVPRETPRMEQRIRADYADKYHLATLLCCKDLQDTELMLTNLTRLPTLPKPSESGLDDPLMGLENINNRIADLLE